MAAGTGAGPGRATATVLFTDLVGSTGIRSRLGDDAADEVRRHCDRLVGEAIQAHHGRLLKKLGDGVMAIFTGACDAVSAAVTIQQALDRDRRSGRSIAPLELRIGLSAGDVVLEDEDCFGTPVIEAARLCAAARGGQVLVTEVVRWLAGSATDHGFTAVDPLDLKGLPAPVTACEVAWEPLPESLVPLPGLLTDMERVFVGREAQLERLGQLWKEAAAGELRMALLAGEPGVGKTRLAAEVAAEVHEAGATVLAGRCDEGLSVPYQPFVEAMRHFVDHTPDEALVARLGRFGGEIVRLLPELAERAPGLPAPLHSDPETERYRLFDAVAGWLAAASAEKPVLLVLDDLHSATKPTLLLLRHLGCSSEAMRLLVLGIYRDTDLGHDHPLVEVLANLRRRGAVERLSLKGLDSAGVAEFMERLAGHALSDDDLLLARAIHEETDGNPFFMIEVLRHLRETGAMERPGGRWAARLPIEEVGIPEGVREVVGKRLAHLSGGANRVLRTGAVMGAEFEPALVELAADLDEDELISALEEAIGARLVQEAGGGKYRFAHALVRDTVYDGLSSLRRVALHRRVAEAIEVIHANRIDDYLPVLAHHWGRASAPTTHAGKAAMYAARAGDRALVQLAHGEAATLYRQALELVEIAEAPVEETWRIDVLISLGEAEHYGGEPGYRTALREAAERAERLGDADRLARAALAGYRGLWDRSLGVDAERVALLEAALRASGDREDVVRARLLAVLAAELMFTADRTRRRDLSDEALALARRLGDPPTLARVLLSRCAAIWDPAVLDERCAAAAELRALAAGLGDPFVKVWASLYSFETAMEGARVEEADRHLEEILRSASEVARALWWFATYPRAGRVLLAGRLEEADALAKEALEIGLATQPIHEVRLQFGVQRFQIRLEQGRLEEVVPNLAEALAEADHAETRAMLAHAYCELGRQEEARDTFEALAPRLSDLRRDPNWIVTMTRSATVCGQLGETSVAGRLYELLLPYSGRLAGQGIVWIGSVDHYLGVLAVALGDPAGAEAHFAAAEATHRRIDAPTWLARTEVEWAAMLSARREPGDAERARELLGHALATCRQIGLPNVERRANELLTRGRG